jgi:hypothetical protein
MGGRMAAHFFCAPAGCVTAGISADHDDGAGGLPDRDALSKPVRHLEKYKAYT